MIPIFVFGTLKHGFPLHDQTISNARYLGCCRTLLAFPMFVAGVVYGPMMLDQPGRGLQVRGELYHVTPEELDAVDHAEGNNLPGNFRKPVALLTETRAQTQAFGFFKNPRLARPRHSGYLENYQDHRFIMPENRPSSLPPLRLLDQIGQNLSPTKE